MAGLEWAPDSVDHPLAGLVPHEVRVQRAAHPYGGTEEWVEVARLWVYETQVSMSRSEATLQVRLGSAASLMDRALTNVQPASGETCQHMIRRVAASVPADGYPLVVLDTSPAGHGPAD